MLGFEGIGKVLIIVGIIIRRDGISFYFPVVTFLLLSIILTVVINIIFRILK